MIFKKLQDQQIPFSVGIAHVRMTLAEDNGGTEHFVTIPYQYRDEFKGTKLSPAHKLTAEKPLSKLELKWFYRNLDEFNLVVDTKAGKIYEHQSGSLRKYTGVRRVA